MLGHPVLMKDTENWSRKLLVTINFSLGRDSTRFLILAKQVLLNIQGGQETKLDQCLEMPVACKDPC